MLHLSLKLPIVAENAGLAVAADPADAHPRRVISSFELILVRRGRLLMQEEKRRFEVRAGQTLILYPNRSHGGVGSYPRDLMFYWVHFRLRPSTGQRFSPPQFGTPKSFDRLVELFHHFMDNQASKQFRQERADILLTLILWETSQCAGSTETRRTLDLTARVQRYISINCNRGLTAGAVAQAMSCNADYLGRVFARCTGQTLTQAIHHQRLRKACTLLRESSLNIKQIARTCGIPDPRYFRRVFIRYKGISPRQYRQLYSHVHVNT